MIKILVKKPLFSKSNSDYRFDIKKVRYSKLGRNHFNEETILNLMFDDIDRAYCLLNDFRFKHKNNQSSPLSIIIHHKSNNDSDLGCCLTKHEENDDWSLNLEVSDSSGTAGQLTNLTYDEIRDLMDSFNQIIYALTRGGIEL